MRTLIVLSLVAALSSLAACSRCVADDNCNQDGKNRVLDINVQTVPSVTMRYTACEALRYRQIGFGPQCSITWQ